MGGLSITITLHGILCAQKQPTNKWNFEYEKTLYFLYPSGTSKTTEYEADEIMPPISDGWFLT